MIEASAAIKLGWIGGGSQFVGFHVLGVTSRSSTRFRAWNNFLGRESWTDLDVTFLLLPETLWVAIRVVNHNSVGTRQRRAEGTATQIDLLIGSANQKWLTINFTDHLSRYRAQKVDFTEGKSFVTVTNFCLAKGCAPPELLLVVLHTPVPFKVLRFPTKRPSRVGSSHGIHHKETKSHLDNSFHCVVSWIDCCVGGE